MDERQYNASCMNGHVHKASRAEMVSLFGEDLVKQIDAGEVLSAPILPHGECYDCQYELERRDCVNERMLGSFDDFFAPLPIG